MGYGLNTTRGVPFNPHAAMNLRQIRWALQAFQEDECYREHYTGQARRAKAVKRGQA